MIRLNLLKRGHGLLFELADQPRRRGKALRYAGAGVGLALVVAVAWMLFSPKRSIPTSPGDEQQLPALQDQRRAAVRSAVSLPAGEPKSAGEAPAAETGNAAAAPPKAVPQARIPTRNVAPRSTATPAADDRDVLAVKRSTAAPSGPRVVASDSLQAAAPPPAVGSPIAAPPAKTTPARLGTTQPPRPPAVKPRVASRASTPPRSTAPQAQPAPPPASIPKPPAATAPPPAGRRESSENPARYPFVVRVALYRQRGRAVRDVRSFRRRGMIATWQQVVYRRSGAWYGVYVGRFAAHAEARAFASNLVRRKLAQEFKIVHAPYVVEVRGGGSLEQRVARLVKRGYPVFLFPRKKPPDAAQRVFVGVFGLRRLAGRMAQRLTADGFRVRRLEP